MNHAAPDLFSPVRFGALELPNRVVMAPLTRLRAEPDGTPTELMVEHYAQRAGVGLIVAEGTWPCVEGRTWATQPGIATAEHVAGWRAVTDAVHAAGGRIALQLMHGGRVSHPDVTGTGRVVGPSAVASPQPVRTPTGKADAPVPHALEAEEIPGVVQDFVDAARRALEAGFDAVQLHGANGYLIHQFLAPSSNRRTDAYGGSARNRARFAIEVTRAVVEAVGADRVSIRLSPEHNVQGAVEEDHADVEATYHAYAEAVADLGLAFVDVLHEDPAGGFVQSLRARLGAPLVVNTGFPVVTTRQAAADAVASGIAEAVGVGRPVIANPDLVERWRHDAEENEPDARTFYGGGAAGYTDYPALERAGV